MWWLIKMAEFLKPPCKGRGTRMSIEKVFQDYETRFWKVVTPMMGEKGMLMKIVQSFQNILKSRVGYLFLLGIIWAAVGFLSGMVLGRVIYLVQFF